MLLLLIILSMKKHFEIFLLKIAYLIINRNIARSPVISRRDNNYLFEVSHRIKNIIHNIKTEYNETN